MRSNPPARATIGFLSTWSVYEGTTIDDYTHALLQGVCAAARESGCNLLIGCGISLPGSPLASRTAWSAPGADWSGKFDWTVPDGKYILSVSIVRPTGFSVRDQSYDDQGVLIP